MRTPCRLQCSAWTTHRCAFAGKYHRGRQKSSLPTEHRPTLAIKTAGYKKNKKKKGK
jgi:hypothetical protein